MVHRLPDKSAISRFRLSLDVAFMLWRRAFHYVCQRRGVGRLHFLLWDSSPQYARDYEMVLVESVSWSSLASIRTCECQSILN